MKILTPQQYKSMIWKTKIKSYLNWGLRCYKFEGGFSKSEKQFIEEKLNEYIKQFNLKVQIIKVTEGVYHYDLSIVS